MTVESVDERPVPARADEDDDRLGFEVTRRKLAAFVLFVVLAVAAMYLLLPQVAGLDETWHRLESGSPFWLAAGALLTLGMFGGYVFQFQTTFRGAKLNWKESYQITMAALAASRIFSAGGAGGLVLQAWALRRAGLEARTVADKSVSFIVVQYLVYTLSIVIFGYLLYFGVLPGNNPFTLTFVPATLAAVVTIGGLSLGFVPPDLQKRLSEWCDKGGRGRQWLTRLALLPASASAGVRDALHHIRDLDRALLGAIAFWGFQLAVLWAAFVAFGNSPPLAVLVMGFFLGMLGNLLPLPGGIGGVDGGMIAAFAAFGVDGGLAAVAVLAYRAFTFWLPTIPGIIAYLQLRKTVDRWRTEGGPALA